MFGYFGRAMSHKTADASSSATSDMPAPHHGHTHPHDHAVRGWARHALSEVFGAHSHDPADQVDDALQADAAGRRALLISLVGLGVTAAIQLFVVALSGSVALL